MPESVTNEHLAAMLHGLSRDVSIVQSDIREVKRHVDGGSDTDRGLIMRVKLLEHEQGKSQESAKNARAVAWSALGTAAGAAVLWGWNRLTGKHN